MEMAGMDYISATAYSQNSCFNVTKIQEMDFAPKILSVEQDSDRKQFIPIYINRYRVIAFVDSGSDLTLIQEPLLNKIIPNKERKYTPSKVTKLMSASGDTMSTLGKLIIHVYFKRDCPPLIIPVTVIPHNSYTPTFILGADTLEIAKVDLSFGSTPPKFIMNSPFHYESPVYWFSPTQQYYCVSYYFLDPYETAKIRFSLNSAAPVIRTDFILITSLNVQEVQIFPSRDQLDFDYVQDCYTARATVYNLTDQKIKGLIWGRYEILSDKKVIPIREGQRDNLRKNLKTHPFGREILSCNLSSSPSVDILTINKISILENNFDEPDVRILDFTPENTIMSGEPTYTGTVKITPELIDPKGIELPTQIFKNAAEAIDLQKYNEEIRPFIQDIFINKYPEVVALHAIDAGDLSLTLGLTQIRLKPGEILPRCKRIFHMSPTDNRHLDDICDLLIRFGYLIKAPIKPDGNHLYGMASYLVSRAKPGTLGRLIVDYSVRF